MTNTKKILLALLAVVAIGGAWSTFARRASTPADTPPERTDASEIIAPVATILLRVFFSSAAYDPGALDCNATYAVERRVPETQAVGRAALEGLLKGPTDTERAAGYSTNINSDVQVRSLAVRDGVAYVDFDARIEEGTGGSCRVAAIRSQIANTLKQFPTVRDVVISVEGRVEDALQP